MSTRSIIVVYNSQNIDIKIFVSIKCEIVNHYFQNNFFRPRI